MYHILTFTKNGMMSITTASSSLGSFTGDSRNVDKTATIGGRRNTNANTDLANVASAAYNTHWQIHAAHIGGLPEQEVLL